MSGQHLQGWRLNAGDEHAVMDATGSKLVNVPCGGMSGRTFAQAAEVACLIVSAPELLEALRCAPLPGRGEEMMEFRDRQDKWLREFRNPALAKATGAA